MQEDFRIKKHKKRKIIIITISSVLSLFLGSGLFLLYGPWPNFREWLITTAMTTMNHQYLATWFYSDQTIQKVLNNNVVIESGENTNPDLIKIGNINFNVSQYTNEYERAILTKDENNDDYKLIEIKGKGYKGYLVAVYDPSKVSVVATKLLGKSGQYLTKMAKDNKAKVAINGGGFIDPGHNSTGGMPTGVTISNGKVVSDYSGGSRVQMIGFDNQNKLVLARMTKQEALQKGIRDAVSFSPYLIVNGKPSFIKGNGGWGTAPRTAIGQRKDGIVLFLVIDGRRIGMPGADMVDLTEIMQNYGAYNAANLDGGTSSVLVINDKMINDPIDSTGAHKTRPISTAFILK